MIIDCHIHLSGDRVAPDVLEVAAELGIERLCASSLGRVWAHEPPPEVFLEGNVDVAAAMERDPGVILGYCTINPFFHDESMRSFQQCIEEHGMIGLKLWVAANANDPVVFPYVEKAIEYGVPVLQHAWHKAGGNLPHESDPVQVAELARRYPEADIIMAHIGGNWEWGIEAVRDRPNVLVDTSGSCMEMGMVESAVEALGADRVLFGSDAAGVDIAGTVGKVTGAHISDEDKKKIMGANMHAVLARRRA